MMEINLMVLHLLAGMSCGKEATCGPEAKPKIKHSREEDAIRHANGLNNNPRAHHRVEPYPCPYCYFWHVGREMTMEELKSLAEMEVKP